MYELQFKQGFVKAAVSRAAVYKSVRSESFHCIFNANNPDDDIEFTLKKKHDRERTGTDCADTHSRMRLKLNETNSFVLTRTIASN